MYSVPLLVSALLGSTLVLVSLGVGMVKKTLLLKEDTDKNQYDWLT